jgi:hypothetical protein
MACGIYPARSNLGTVPTKARGDNRPPRPRFDSLAGRCLTAKNGEAPACACGQKGREVTGDQCRAARERLDWTRHDLCEAARVPLWVIAALEDGQPVNRSTTAAIRAALEAAGVEFIAENGEVPGVRLRKASK